MKVTHRASAALATPAVTPLAQSADKAPRLSCCCRLSELLPLVRQAHEAARAARLGTEEQPGVAA
ncbi:MAG: hypothetical protein EOO59_05155 [Hymenobacter sp.]|nr:MAG: hypothetical protein EOO59_05155 [Hymenobacter sp.]